MTKPNRQYLQGILTATVAVAEVTGDLSLDGMPQQTWDLIHKINARLLQLASEEAERLEGVHSR